MTPRGPIEDGNWPRRLIGRVGELSPGRLHGYDVEEDLARHYSFASLLLLALTGELPGERERRALDIAFAFLAPVDVAEAPGHAAHLGRLCGATDAGVLGVAALALIEQARWELAAHAEWLEYLDHPEGAPPASSRASTAEEAASVRRLCARLEEAGWSLGWVLQPAGPGPGRTAALLAVLHAAGLRSGAALLAAWVVARLPGAVAEGMAATPLAFRGYPIDVPPFRYEAPRAE